MKKQQTRKKRFRRENSSTAECAIQNERGNDEPTSGPPHTFDTENNMRILRLLTIAVVIQIWTGAVIYAHGQVMAEDMLIRTPTVIAAITELHSHTHLGGMDKTEWSVVVRADGTPSKPYSSHDWASNHLTVRIGSDLAIIHSHPDGTAPYPSQSDQNAAKQCHIPNYEISAYHIYVAEPDGKTVRKVADIEQGKHNTINIKWGAK